MEDSKLTGLKADLSKRLSATKSLIRDGLDIIEYLQCQLAALSRLDSESAEAAVAICKAEQCLADSPESTCFDMMAQTPCGEVDIATVNSNHRDTSSLDSRPVDAKNGEASLPVYGSKTSIEGMSLRDVLTLRDEGLYPLPPLRFWDRVQRQLNYQAILKWEKVYEYCDDNFDGDASALCSYFSHPNGDVYTINELIEYIVMN